MNPMSYLKSDFLESVEQVNSLLNLLNSNESDIEEIIQAIESSRFYLRALAVSLLKAIDYDYISEENAERLKWDLYSKFTYPYCSPYVKRNMSLPELLGYLKPNCVQFLRDVSNPKKIKGTRIIFFDNILSIVELITCLEEILAEAVDFKLDKFKPINYELPAIFLNWLYSKSNNTKISNLKKYIRSTLDALFKYAPEHHLRLMAQNRKHNTFWANIKSYSDTETLDEKLSQPYTHKYIFGSIKYDKLLKKVFDCLKSEILTLDLQESKELTQVYIYLAMLYDSYVIEEMDFTGIAYRGNNLIGEQSLLAEKSSDLLNKRFDSRFMDVIPGTSSIGEVSAVILPCIGFYTQNQNEFKVLSKALVVIDNDFGSSALALNYLNFKPLTLFEDYMINV